LIAAQIMRDARDSEAGALLPAHLDLARRLLLSAVSCCSRNFGRGLN